MRNSLNLIVEEGVFYTFSERITNQYMEKHEKIEVPR